MTFNKRFAARVFWFMFFFLFVATTTPFPPSLQRDKIETNGDKVTLGKSRVLNKKSPPESVFDTVGLARGLCQRYEE